MIYLRFLATVLIVFAASSLLLAQDPLPPPGPDYSSAAAIENPVSPVRGPIAGMVRFPAGEDSSQPVLVRLESDTGVLFDQAWTRKSGRFEFSHVGCGTYVITLDVAGYRPIRERVEHSYEPLEGVALYLVRDENQTLSASGTAAPSRERTIPEKARKEYAKGLEAFSSRKPEQSIPHFRKAIEFFPDYDDAYVQLGLAYLGKNAFGEAQKVAETAISRNSKNAHAHALLGVALREQNHPQEALKALEESLKLGENSWFAQLEVGRTLLKVGRVNDAFPHLTRAHELNTSSPLVHLNLYNALILRDDYRAAAAELDDFLALFPTHPQAAQARKQREALAVTLAQRQP